jgi:glyceraldehyde-3-phosphate dehydrogenase (NADP+)
VIALQAGRPDYLTICDPDDGSVVAELPVTTDVALDEAVENSATAFAQNRMPPLHERIAILHAVAQAVSDDVDDYANCIAREGIKTIREANKEARRCIETLRIAAQEAARLEGRQVPFSANASTVDRKGFYEYRAAGVVVAITPFNDPLNLVAHKLAPAFAVGAPVIIKPHPATPLSALKLVQAFHDAGAPRDTVQCVIGGSETGQKLVADNRVRIISFTGSQAAGYAISRAAGFKKLLLELGGVGVIAVTADANVEQAAQAIHNGAFWAAGQNCVHAQRVIAEQSVAQPLIDRLVELTGSMTLTRKLDPASDMGPLLDDAAYRRMDEIIASAKAQNGEVLIGGERAERHFLPTWIRLAGANCQLTSQEIFGPISTIENAANDRELLRTMSCAQSAIHQAIFTNRMDLILDSFATTPSAALIVNDSTDFRIDAMPFGGSGSAGIGREGVADAMIELTEKKLLVLRQPLSLA